MSANGMPIRQRAEAAAGAALFRRAEGIYHGDEKAWLVETLEAFAKVNAFDALLEVAQALVNDPDANGLSCRTENAITALDAAHPGWREWTA
jgi:hypothetical protein